ncbi:hypothetical protein GGR56DRAFT_312806 [Xylariaceae sp. FL0804]|nr:hypothetical protein GGR56DRAFT_312806 [Xylariaceae sp. FL0804]
MIPCRSRCETNHQRRICFKKVAAASQPPRFHVGDDHTSGTGRDGMDHRQEVLNTENPLPLPYRRGPAGAGCAVASPIVIIVVSGNHSCSLACFCQPCFAVPRQPMEADSATNCTTKQPRPRSSSAYRTPGPEASQSGSHDSCPDGQHGRFEIPVSSHAARVPLIERRGGMRLINILLPCSSPVAFRKVSIQTRPPFSLARPLRAEFRIPTSQQQHQQQQQANKACGLHKHTHTHTYTQTSTRAHATPICR